MEDSRLQKLRDLRDHAIAVQDSATKLVVEITDQLQRSIWLHSGTSDDRPTRRRRERRKKPRSE